MLLHCAGLESAAEVLTECIAFCVETLPSEPYVGVLLDIAADQFWQEASSPKSRELAMASLSRLPVDGADLRFDEGDTVEVFDYLLSVLRPLITKQATAPLDGQWLRRYVARWVIPGLVRDA